MRGHPRAGNSGYEAGQGRTFTPSAGADWTEEFNFLMTTLNKSRNEMTEDLIRDGLLARRGKETGLTTFYSAAEIEFLKKPVMQKLVKDYYSILNGGSPLTVAQTLMEPSPPVTTFFRESKSDEVQKPIDELPLIEVSQKNARQPLEIVLKQEESVPSETDNDEMDLLKKAAAELSRMGLKIPK